jgi:hypothetical protein
MSVKAAQDLNLNLAVPGSAGGGVRPEQRGSK